MADFYDDMAASAAQMIEQYGAAFELRRSEAGDYVPGTGGGDATDTTWTGRAVRLRYSGRMVDGTTVRAGDVRLLASVAGIPAPRVGDECTLAGDSSPYKVLNITTIQPGATVLAYELQLRQ